MTISEPALKNLLPLWATRGATIARQGKVFTDLQAQAPTDLRPVLSAALVLAQSATRAQVVALNFVLADALFPTLSLSCQNDMGRQAVRWNQLAGLLASLAFHERMPLFEAGALPRQLSMGQAGVALGVSLEKIVNTPALAGMYVKTFWEISPSAQIAIGRLLALDLVLESSNLPFDPFEEGVLALREAVAFAPAAQGLLENIARVTSATKPDETLPVRNPALSVHAVGVLVTEGDDLESLAAKFMGDRSAWRSLALLNNLKAPYISETPVADALGGSLGLLALAATASGDTTTLTDVLGIFPGHRVRFDNGITQETVEVQEINTVTKVLTFTTALANSYVTTTVVNLYAPTADIRGKVLKIGDTLWIPTNEQRSTGVRSNEPLASIERAYGVDILATRQGRFTISVEGDFDLVTGANNLVQAIRHRFKVEQGMLPLHPRYGTGLFDFLAQKNVIGNQLLLETEGRQTTLRDPRIDAVEDVTAVLLGDAVTMEIQAVTSQRERFPLFTVEIQRENP